MGILNTTPDSFFEDSRIDSTDKLLPQAEKHLNEGATILDIGGYSTRPNAYDISVDEELKRVIPAIEKLTINFPTAVISVDTFREKVAEEAISAGASIVNDISGGNIDPTLFPTLGKLKVPYILSHIKGTPQTMLNHCNYDNLIEEMIHYFSKKVNELTALGVHDIIIDPGFGFAKNVEQNFEILNNLGKLKMFGLPVMAGLSRKSMIYKTLNTDAKNALNGTTCLNTIALLKGAKILRVHDVKEAKECINLVTQLTA